MLYLDKCWNELQILLGPESGLADRPALQLVAGQVTHTETGWIPFERALNPVQVRAIAVDLATFEEADIRRILPRLRRRDESSEEEYEYVAQYLSDAQEFTARLASDGRGLVYLIG